MQSIRIDKAGRVGRYVGSSCKWYGTAVNCTLSHLVSWGLRLVGTVLDPVKFDSVNYLLQAFARSR